MAERPIVLTETDVKDPNLLLRHLRKIAEGLAMVSDRIGRVETVPRALTMPEIKRSLEAVGSTPLNVENLLGRLGEPQLAKVTHYAALPTGPILQSLRDNQLVTVGTTSTGDTLYRVVAGNPSTLRTISPVPGAHAATHYSTGADPLTGTLSASLNTASAAASCGVTNSGSITAADATFTLATYDTEYWDNGAMHNSSSSGDLVAPVAGVYVFVGHVRWAISPSIIKDYAARIAHSDGSRQWDVTIQGPRAGTGPPVVTNPVLVQMASGESVSLHGWWTSTTTSTSETFTPFFWGAKLA